HFDTSKSRTSPAMRTGKPEASKRVIGPMPGRPATIASQAAGTPIPTGETMPRPVTTTRRRDMGETGSIGRECGAARAGRRAPPGTRRRRQARRDAAGPALLLQVRADVGDRLLDGGDLLRFLVRDLGLELLLERHHQFDGVERVRAQIVDERRLVLDVG